ncbi:MAG TPA: hypothetical protein VLJ60_02325, partial [bacterium]|nr:hypothetical protein [bacterium]
IVCGEDIEGSDTDPSNDSDVPVNDNDPANDNETTDDSNLENDDVSPAGKRVDDGCSCSFVNI